MFSSSAFGSGLSGSWAASIGAISAATILRAESWMASCSSVREKFIVHLWHRVAAVDAHDLTGRPRGPIADQEGDRGCDVIRLADATDWVHLHHVLLPARVFLRAHLGEEARFAFLAQLGIRSTGRDDVERDV